jgi:hypothetical protein
VCVCVCVCRLVTHAVMVLIVVNTVVLSADHYPMDHSTGTILDIINFVLTVFFAVEMGLKVLGSGVKGYLR